MNREDIIRMAQEVGWDAHHAEFDPRIERFAAIVVSAEREACAKIADEWAVGWPHPSKVIALDIRARGQA
jgi:hypothetical protein